MRADRARLRVSRLQDREAVLVVGGEFGQVPVLGERLVVRLDQAGGEHELDGQVLDQYLAAAAVGGEEDGRQLAALRLEELDADVRERAQVEGRRRERRQRRRRVDPDVRRQRDLAGSAAEDDVAVGARPDALEADDGLEPLDDLGASCDTLKPSVALTRLSGQSAAAAAVEPASFGSSPSRSKKLIVIGAAPCRSVGRGSGR